ncbi:hypothetical protein V462_02180 [Pantoea ananatis 15320]|nr:hypothetical protein L585_08860 [Pantoea ananatis BRT175]PKC41111.1 hypothetical protein V462_02180 [Pantoea ananatis 15320]
MIEQDEASAVSAGLAVISSPLFISGLARL